MNICEKKKKLILSFPKIPGMDLNHSRERSGKGSASWDSLNWVSFLPQACLEVTDPSLLWPSQGGMAVSAQTFSAAGAGGRGQIISVQRKF